MKYTKNYWKHTGYPQIYFLTTISIWSIRNQQSKTCHTFKDPPLRTLIVGTQKARWCQSPSHIPARTTTPWLRSTLSPSTSLEMHTCKQSMSDRGWRKGEKICMRKWRMWDLLDKEYFHLYTWNSVTLFHYLKPE